MKQITFYPVTYCRVTVEVEHESKVEHKSEAFPFHVLKEECTMCRRMLEESHLIDCINAVNWPLWERVMLCTVTISKCTQRKYSNKESKSG